MEAVKVRFEKEVLEKFSKALDVSVDWLINAVPQCNDGQECLYLWRPEGCKDFKLYIKGTSLREAYLNIISKLRKLGISPYNNARERSYIELVGVPIGKRELQAKFKRASAKDEDIPLEPDER